MSARGITRPVDGLGRIVIPAEYRRMYDISADDLVEIIGTDNGILIKPHYLQCGICGGIDDVQEHRGGLICADCRKFFKTLGTGGTKIPLK